MLLTIHISNLKNLSIILNNLDNKKKYKRNNGPQGSIYLLGLNMYARELTDH